MEGLFELQDLLTRIEIWTGEEIRAKRLMKGIWPLLREAVQAGEYARGRAVDLTGYEERQARNDLIKLLGRGLLTSESERGRSG